MEASGSSLHLSDKYFNVAKFITGIFLPAVGTLYFALAEIWDLPAPKEVLGTIIAIQAFLGVILGISSKSYENSGARYGGMINISETLEGATLYSLELNHEPEELMNKQEITFKVIPSSDVEKPYSQ